MASRLDISTRYHVGLSSQIVRHQDVKYGGTMKPREVIRKEYGAAKNFMTPYVLGVGWVVKDAIAYELSEGSGFDRKPIYGVSLVRVAADGSTSRMYDESKCFDGEGARQRAGEYVRELKENARKKERN